MYYYFVFVAFCSFESMASKRTIAKPPLIPIKKCYIIFTVFSSNVIYLLLMPLNYIPVELNACNSQIIIYQIA